MNMPRHSSRRQSGAVLYVALIMLILLALIGIIGMRVAGLQERMSANYQATIIAFQNAEAGARRTEIDIKDEVFAGINPTTNRPPTDCSAFDSGAWDSASPHVRRLDKCMAWGDITIPAQVDEGTDQVYQITSFSTDRDTFSSSEAVVDTVFIP